MCETLFAILFTTKHTDQKYTLNIYNTHERLYHYVLLGITKHNTINEKHLITKLYQNPFKALGLCVCVLDNIHNSKQLVGLS